MAKSSFNRSLVVPWLLLFSLSIVLHLWALGERSYHHDESIHAHASYVLLRDGAYRYDPTYHGPLLYYMTATAFALVGDTDFTARLPIALCGVGMVAVAFAIRRPLGGRAAWWTGLLVTLSPITLYYGRFLRMDVLELVVASAAVVAVWRAVRGSPWAWIWAGIWIGLAFATKENAFVTSALVVAVAGLMLLVWGFRSTRHEHSEDGKPTGVLNDLAAGFVRAMRAAVAWIGRHRWGLAALVGAFALVTVPLFTVGFRHNSDWFFPYRAISYWWGQHSIQRVAGPPWYHLPRLAIYEFLPIIAAFVWAARRGRRMRSLEWSLLLFGVASVAMYCYLGEKVPWLGVHQVWAFLPLAGLQLARTFGPQGAWWSRTLASIGLLATVVTTITANFILDEISPNLKRAEALVYVQTSPELLVPMNDVLRLADEGQDPAAAVGGEVAWPATWYLRSTPVWWSEPAPGMRPPIVFCDVAREIEVRRMLGPGYTPEKMPLRSWWVMADRLPTLRELVRYLFTRVPWGVIGSTDTIVFRYTGEEDQGARSVPPPETVGTALGFESARLVGDGWLVEPRGLAVSADGIIAVADGGAGDVMFFAEDGSVSELRVPESLNQPESVAWTPDGVLVIADTWNHRVLLFSPKGGVVRPVPVPDGGWFGPRAVAVAPDGAVAISDTGNKRIVLMTMADGVPQLTTIGREGSAPGELVEPVGLVWLDNRRLLVCDTGNRRLQVLDRSGSSLEVVPLDRAWADFYSRPQVVVLSDGQWLVSDIPSRCLWLVDGSETRQIDLGAEGIVPTGLAVDGERVLIADLNARVWVLSPKAAVDDVLKPDDHQQSASGG
ncbi:MAG: TIGR03663 family protein [Holophagae bacterium]